MGRILIQDLQILKFLLKEELITRDLYEGAIHKFEAYGGFLDVILMDIGNLDEKALLSAIAAYHETKFVTTDKLRNADFGRDIISMLPVKMAKAFTAFPINYDDQAMGITIITPNVADINAIAEMEKQPGIRKVTCYVALSDTVKRAIRKWYEKDASAFEVDPMEDIDKYHQVLDVYEKTVIDENRQKSIEQEVSAIEVKVGPIMSSHEKVFDENDFDATAKAKEEEEAAEPAVGGITAENFLSTLQILVGLLERERPDLKGHSVQVSRFIKQVGDRIRIPKHETYAYAIAGVLHDMGKSGMFHLTTLNVSLYEGHKNSAEKSYQIPTKIFETVAIPEQTKQAIESMYERYDGKGFPGIFAGKDIPLGARILAAADSFSDLVMNPRNPFRDILSNEEAIKAIEKHKEGIFDPVVVNALKLIVAGGKLRDSILVGQNSLLVVDSDTEQGTILDLNFANAGFNVEVCDNSRIAMEKIKAKNFDVVLTEVDLEPIDGFELIKRIKSNDKFKDVPVIFYTTRSSPKDVDMGFSLGAADYLVKPSSIELLIAKIMKTMRDAAAKAVAPTEGASGSLKEMDLPDLIQILSQGRKTGKLKITSNKKEGEIHFLTGAIVNALIDDKEGEDAFYAMLHFSDGYFNIDPKFTPSKTVINIGTEALLLEGMRILDESLK